MFPDYTHISIFQSNKALLKGVRGLSLRSTELPAKMAGIIWLMAERIGKSKEERIRTVPNYTKS